MPGVRRCRELDFSGIVPPGHCILNVCMFQKMYFLTDYSPGTNVSCFVHLWLLLSYKMHSFFFLFSAGQLVSWALVFHAVHTGG